MPGLSVVGRILKSPMTERLTIPPPATPVKRAYEQVASQIRQWILTGYIGIGEKLPAEAELCRQFGTSRSTVREALRLLASERLIITQPGARGGSVVSRPSVANVTADLTTSLGALVGGQDLSVPEMVQVRLLMEVPAAGLAAEQRTDDQLARLAALVPAEVPGVEDLFEMDLAFHHTLLEATGNRLLPIVAIPVFEVSARRVPRDRLDRSVWRRVIDEHSSIVDAVRARDVAAAERAMHLHLVGLATAYERASTAAQEESA